MGFEDEVTATKKIAGRGNKYMVFTLGEDRFAIPLSQVKEVIGLIKISPVPDVPKYFKGLINLRGRIISTVDLRTKLGIPVKETAAKKACIIISEVGGLVMGSIVDDVAEVVGIDEKQIEKQLDISSKVSREYITGVAKIESKPLTLLLDIGKVLNIDEFAQLRQQGEKARAA